MAVLAHQPRRDRGRNACADSCRPARAITAVTILLTDRADSRAPTRESHTGPPRYLRGARVLEAIGHVFQEASLSHAQRTSPAGARARGPHSVVLANRRVCSAGEVRLPGCAPRPSRRRGEDSGCVRHLEVGRAAAAAVVREGRARARHGPRRASRRVWSRADGRAAVSSSRIGSRRAARSREIGLRVVTREDPS